MLKLKILEPCSKNARFAPSLKKCKPNIFLKPDSGYRTKNITPFSISTSYSTMQSKPKFKKRDNVLTISVLSSQVVRFRLGKGTQSDM